MVRNHPVRGSNAQRENNYNAGGQPQVLMKTKKTKHSSKFDIYNSPMIYNAISINVIWWLAVKAGHLLEYYR